MLDGRNLSNGTTALTTTAIPISTSTLVILSVLIQNDPANTVNVLIGTPTAQTIKLVPGASIEIEVDVLNKVYAKTESGTATVNYIVS